MTGRPKRVIYFSDSEGFGGAEEVLLQFLTHLDRQSCEPILFYHAVASVPPLVGRVDALGIRTVAVPRIARATDLPRLPAFVRAVRAEGPDVFHAQLTWPMSCRFGLVAARLARVPAVLATSHSRFDVLPIEAIQPRFIATCVDRYIAVAGGVAQQLRDFGISPRKITIIHNGIPLLPSPGDRSALRAALGGEDRSIVLTVARLEVRKGLVDLVKAAALVPDALFLIAGEGPERAVIEAHIASERVGNRVRLLGHRGDVRALLHAADAFVLPSYTEGLPISILEAMSAGVPVVATDIAGVNELVVPDRTGLLVPVQDPVSLAAAIRRTLDEVDEARTMAVTAARRAADEFSIQRMVDRVCAVYEEVLHRRPNADHVAR